MYWTLIEEVLWVCGSRDDAKVWVNFSFVYVDMELIRVVSVYNFNRHILNISTDSLRVSSMSGYLHSERWYVNSCLSTIIPSFPSSSLFCLESYIRKGRVDDLSPCPTMS